MLVQNSSSKSGYWRVRHQYLTLEAVIWLLQHVIPDRWCAPRQDSTSSLEVSRQAILPRLVPSSFGRHGLVRQPPARPPEYQAATSEGHSQAQFLGFERWNTCSRVSLLPLGLRRACLVGRICQLNMAPRHPAAGSSVEVARAGLTPVHNAFFQRIKKSSRTVKRDGQTARHGTKKLQQTVVWDGTCISLGISITAERVLLSCQSTATSR